MSNIAPLRLRNIRHPFRLLAFLLVVLILLGTAFFLGSRMASPTDRARENARDDIPVSVAIEMRAVGEQLRLPGVVRAGSTFELMLGGGGSGQEQGSVPAVLSDIRARVGEPAHYGQVLAEVSGRPLIAIAPEIPLYRDLTEGLQGNDVRALQRFLVDQGVGGTRVTGTLDRGNLAAIARIYTRAGYSAPVLEDGSPVIRWLDLIALPVNGAPVISTASLGTRLTEDTVLLTLRLAPNIISTRISVLQAQKLAEGDPVRIAADGRDPAEATVLLIAPFNTDSEGAAGHDVSISLPEALAEALPPESSVQVLSAHEVPIVPAVPLTAILQDDNSSYVLLPATGPEEKPRRVDLRIRAQSAGWASFEENPLLPEGTIVEIGR